MYAWLTLTCTATALGRRVQAVGSRTAQGFAPGKLSVVEELKSKRQEFLIPIRKSDSLPVGGDFFD
jgi:hypothetical protein